MSSIHARERERKKKEVQGETGKRKKESLDSCQLSEAWREGNTCRHGEDSLRVTHRQRHTHLHTLIFKYYILYLCNKPINIYTKHRYWYCTYADWQNQERQSLFFYISTLWVTECVTFKKSKNIWTRWGGCVHTYTDTQKGSIAVPELRTQQSWLPRGVSRRWAEIRLRDCDCMSERICTPQQFSVPFD